MYIDEPNYFNYSERLEYKILLKKPFGEVVGVVKESYNKNFNLNMIGVNDFTFRLSASSEYADDIKVNKHLRVQIIHPEKIDDRDNVIDNPIFYEEEMVITDITKLDTDKKTIQVTAKSISLNLGKRIIENYQSEAAKIFWTDAEISAFTPGDIIDGIEYETKEEFLINGIINYAMSKIPDWTLEEVNFDPSDEYRTIDFTEVSILDIFIDFIPQNFELVPLFNTVNKTIRFVTVSQLGTDVGIMVSHDRIAQQIETSYTNNDFVTQLFVYGEDGRTISSYNPTGQKYITDLSYVANTEFMSQSLIDALDSYKTYVDGKEGELQTHLNTIKQYQADIENLKSSQSALNAEIESLLSELDDFIAEYAGTDPGTWPTRDPSVINSELSQKYKQVDNSYNEVASLSNATGQSVTLSEIYKSELKVTAIIRNSDTGGATPRTKELVENTHYTFDGVNINGLDGTKYYSIAFSYNALFDSDSYEQQIEEKEQLIEDEWALIDQIKQDSDISNFLSESQIKELQPYIRSRVYRNDNIKDVKTLYEKGQEVLERLNSPKITIEVDTVDLYQSLEYSNQWENIRLGNIITVVSDVIPSGSVLMRIIGIEHSSDQNTMRLTLSNTTSVDDDTFELEELLNKANKASINLSVNSSKYGKYVESGQQNELMNYINSELDLAAQKAKAGSNQNVIVDSHGITLNSTVDNLEKMKILNNLLVITEDNFETASVAISPKGVVAERLIGKAIVGNDLTISNNDSTVRIDGEGITISGGALTITGSLPNEITSYVDGEITDVNTSINTLQSEVDTYSEDLKITKLEANSIKNLWAQVESESADLINIANNLNAESYIDIITQINNYNDALSNLETLLNDFIEHDTVTYEYPITITNTQRDGIETKFSNVQSAKSILITAINESIELKSNNYTDNNAVILDEVYNGVEVNQTNGLVVTASDNSAKSIFNATDGIKLQTSTDGGSTWNNNLVAKTDGTLALDSVIATNFTLDGGVMKVGTDTLIDSDGNIDFTNFNTIGTDPRLLEGIAITDTGGNTTFSVDTSGNVTLAGAIDWTNTNSDPATVEAQTTADDAQSTALTAEEIGKNIADGSYSGTFIDNQQIIAPTISAAVINSGTINSITINSADIDISENVSIGEQLIIDAQYLSGIEWRDSNNNEYAEIYIDPASSALFLEANSGGGIYANGQRIDTQPTAVFG